MRGMGISSTSSFLASGKTNTKKNTGLLLCAPPAPLNASCQLLNAATGKPGDPHLDKVSSRTGTFLRTFFDSCNQPFAAGVTSKTPDELYLVSLFSVSFSITPSSWALEVNFESLPRVQPWPWEILCPQPAWSASAPLPGSSPQTLPSLSWAANFSAFKAAL